VIAIYKAIKYIHTEDANTKTKFILLSDSFSNLIAISNTQNPTDITKLIQEEIFLAGKKKDSNSIHMDFGHIGILGNERADHEALNVII